MTKLTKPAVYKTDFKNWIMKIFQIVFLEKNAFHLALVKAKKLIQSVLNCCLIPFPLHSMYPITLSIANHKETKRKRGIYFAPKELSVVLCLLTP